MTGRDRFAIGSLALAAVVSGCHAPPQPDGANQEESAAAPLEALDADALLTRLRRSHQEQRRKLGPHRISVRATFEVIPSVAPATPRPGERAAQDLRVAEQLTLDFVDEKHFHLVQGPAKDASVPPDRFRGREVVRVDERLFVRVDGRAWQSTPAEGDIQEQWLSDAIRAPGDLLEFALRGATVEASAGDAGATFSLKLAGADAVRPAPRNANAQWRRKVEIQEAAGSVELSTATQTWRRANLTVNYSMFDAEGQRVRGLAKLEASLDPIPDSTAVTPPADAHPVRELPRWEHDAKVLLDGIAVQG